MGLALKKQLLVAALFLFSVFSEVKSSTWELFFLFKKAQRGVQNRVPFLNTSAPCCVCYNTPSGPPLLGICSTQENVEDPNCQKRVCLPCLCSLECGWVTAFFEEWNLSSQALMPVFAFRTAVLLEVTHTPVYSLGLRFNIWFHVLYSRLKSTGIGLHLPTSGPKSLGSWRPQEIRAGSEWGWFPAPSVQWGVALWTATFLIKRGNFQRQN